MESVKINVPEGYEIDKEKSTLSEVFFKKKSEMDFDYCLQTLGEDDEEVKEYRKLVAAGSKLVDMQAIIIIVKALNNGWVPDFENTKQKKFYPLFNITGGVSLSYVFCNSQYSHVPPSFLFKDAGTAKLAIKHFLPYYQKVYGN